MLDIFGSDSKKKKEGLRENMDKIRDMVEDEGPQEVRSDQGGGDRQQAGDAPQAQGRQPQPDQQRQAGQQQQGQRQQKSQQTGQRQQGTGQNVEMTQRDDQSGTRTRTRNVQDQQDQGDREQQTGQDRQTDAEQERGEVGLSSDDIPEPPETKEIEVPDIQKGPLFIRVRKFKEAKQMVSRMRELNEDMETQMGGLRNTLEEDQETTRRLNDAMKRLQDSMNTIRDIVSPG